MAQPTKRCAIYTRKSTEEGLEQGFNSLDVQREACENYILSQKAEGWRRVKTRYDDGGLSDGHMERPALRGLLRDIDAERIDIVVVYKFGRLRDPSRLRKARRAIQQAPRFIRVGHCLQYIEFHGAIDLERAVVLRAIRT